MWDIVSKRYWYFTLSSLILIPGIISLILFGLRPSIDYTGGALLELQFKQPSTQLLPAEIEGFLQSAGYTIGQIQTSGSDTVLIRTTHIDQDTKNQIESTMAERYGEFIELRFESIGPSVGKEVTNRALWAVIAAALAILLYISYAFRHVPNPVRYGACAIIAMLHDVFVVIGLASLAGHFLGWEVDALYLTALLTVIGFSVHDTVVVFDRIRENIGRMRGERFEVIVNHSIIQTLDRSINTQLTVMFTLLALFLFGGLTIREFVFWLLIGIASGTYSSIFNASPLLVVWENGEIGQFVRRIRGQGAATA
ncbi:MAG: protein translocase subunit SecF [Chloroflexi bacterium]|nr:protein translocase subunit SecF [Chloroflexota bacterium]